MKFFKTKTLPFLENIYSKNGKLFKMKEAKTLLQEHPLVFERKERLSNIIKNISKVRKDIK